MTQVYSWWVILGIKPLEVDPIMGILQEVVTRVRKDVCPLVDASMEDIWAIPHGIKLPFPYIIIGWMWES